MVNNSVIENIVEKKLNQLKSDDPSNLDKKFAESLKLGLKVLLRSYGNYIKIKL